MRSGAREVHFVSTKKISFAMSHQPRQEPETTIRALAQSGSVGLGSRGLCAPVWLRDFQSTIAVHDAMGFRAFRHPLIALGHPKQFGSNIGFVANDGYGAKLFSQRPVMVRAVVTL
jgi:hypothetical protein